MTSTTHTRTPGATWGIWPRAALGAALAFASNLVVWTIATAAGVNVMIPQPPNMDAYAPLTTLPLVMSSVIPPALAALGLLVLRRLRPNPSLPIFGFVVLTLTVLSLGAPLTLDVDTGNRLTLAAMHLVTGMAVIGTQVWGTGSGPADIETKSEFE